MPLEIIHNHKYTWQNGWIGLGSGWVNRVASQKQVILSRFKTGSGQSGCESGQVNPYFSHDFFFFLIKKTTCIINTYSIILKLYKS